MYHHDNMTHIITFTSVTATSDSLIMKGWHNNLIIVDNPILSFQLFCRVNFLVCLCTDLYSRVLLNFKSADIIVTPNNDFAKNYSTHDGFDHKACVEI